MVSFARDDSRNIATNDVFSLQALNESLNGTHGNTLVEINLRVDKQGKGLKSKRGGTRSRSRSSKLNSRDMLTSQAVGLVTSQQSSLEDNIRNQLLSTSLNEDILEQL